MKRKKSLFIALVKMSKLKSLFIIVCALSCMLTSVPSRGQETNPTMEQIGQAIEKDVEQIYAKEGGKRSKREIRLELIKRGMVKVYNELIQKDLDAGYLESGRKWVEQYEANFVNSPEYKNSKALPEEEQTMILAGDIEKLSGNYSKALSYLSRAIKINPNSFYSYISKSAIHWQLKECNLSLINTKKAIEVDPVRYWNSQNGKVILDAEKTEAFAGMSRLQIIEVAYKTSCGK